MEGVSLVRSASFKERAVAAALRAEAAAHEQRTQQDVEALADVEAELTRLLSGGAPGEPAGSGGSWICSQCTFENRSLPGSACEMCGSSGSGLEPEPEPEEGQEDSAGQAAGWICSQCTYENDSPPGTACAMCGCGGADDDGAALRHALEAEQVRKFD